MRSAKWNRLTWRLLRFQNDYGQKHIPGLDDSSFQLINLFGRIVDISFKQNYDLERWGFIKSDFQKFRKGAKLGLSISYPRSSNQKDLISYR